MGLRSVSSPHFDNLHTREHVDEVTLTYDFRLPGVNLSVVALNSCLNPMVDNPVGSYVPRLPVRILPSRELNGRYTFRGLNVRSVRT